MKYMAQKIENCSSELFSGRKDKLVTTGPCMYEIFFHTALITSIHPYLSFVIIKMSNLSRFSASSDAAKSLHLNYLALWRHSLSDL